MGKYIVFGKNYGKMLSDKMNEDGSYEEKKLLDVVNFILFRDKTSVLTFTSLSKSRREKTKRRREEL